jgi:hypothetical protein
MEHNITNLTLLLTNNELAVKDMDNNNWMPINASDFNDMVADEIEIELYYGKRQATQYTTRINNKRLDITNSPKSVFSNYGTVTSVNVGEGVVWNSLQITELLDRIIILEEKVAKLENKTLCADIQ